MVACVCTGGFISVKIPNVKPAGEYLVIVRLPGATPTTLSTYPSDVASLDGQLRGSPVNFTFEKVKCAEFNEVPSTDGSLCVCGPGYVRVEQAGSGGSTATCEACPQGFYRDNIDASSCQACDASRSTLSTGSAHASDCVCNPGCVSMPRTCILFGWCWSNVFFHFTQRSSCPRGRDCANASTHQVLCLSAFGYRVWGMYAGCN